MDSELISRINTALIESGDRERLKQLVKNKLEESGWFKVMKEEADKVLVSRNVESMSPQELCSILSPKATEAIPNDLKEELQNTIHSFLESHIHL